MARVTASRKKDTKKLAKQLKSGKEAKSKILPQIVKQQSDLDVLFQDSYQAAATELKKALDAERTRTKRTSPKETIIKFGGKKFVGGVKLVSFFASKKAADKAIDATIKVHKAAERGWKKGSVY